MSSEQIKRVKAIFAEASEIQPGGRGAFLERACGGDAWLRAEVEALLSAAEKADGFLISPTQKASPTVAQRLNDPGEEGPGSLIGPYKLLQRIGEGGFGIVFMAEQEHPIRRRVAVKIIKPGMDTKQVIARFEAERQALAMMDHPNIAKVFDAGATQTGRPYFVMELVHGMSITEYCDGQSLTTRQRVELFIQVCQAIQHAHQKGVIHRDIKPNNVLVTMHDDRPVPKVIDFGIAKAISQRLTEKTLFTDFRQFVGTPAYMSPEQAQMNELDIDTRSDIYSLGVLLYELLTGSTPFEARNLLSMAYDEMRRVIREVEPPKPSTRLDTLAHQTLSNVAGHRQTDPRHLSQSVRGDLDWIVMRCLEKDRTRRYETASGLAADIGRHLSNEPVVAGPPSGAYRFRKLVKRNKLVFGAIAAVMLALLLGTCISTWQAVRATRAEARARADFGRAVVAEDLLTFLERHRSHDTEAQTLLKQGLEEMSANQGLADPQTLRYMALLACLYEDEQRYGEAEALDVKAVEGLQKAIGGADASTLWARENLADVYSFEGRNADASAAQRQADESIVGRDNSELSQNNISAVQSARILTDRGRARTRLGLFRLAEADFARSIAADPGDLWPWYYRACLLARLNDAATYGAHCKAMLDRFGGSSDWYVVNRVCKACLLLPGCASPRQMEAMNERDRKGTEISLQPYFDLNRALVLYRCGDFEGCLQSAQSVNSPRIEADLLISMAEERLNRHYEARGALKRAETRLDSLPPAGVRDVVIEDWLIYQTLHGEAQALIRPYTATAGLDEEMDPVSGAKMKLDFISAEAGRYPDGADLICRIQAQFDLARDTDAMTATNLSKAKLLHLFNDRGRALLRLGNFRLADGDFDRAMKLSRGAQLAWCHRACMLAYLDDRIDYPSVCGMFSSRWTSNPDHWYLAHVIESRLLLPGGGDPQALREVAERAITRDSLEDPVQAQYMLCKILVLYRTGDFAACVDCAQKPFAEDDDAAGSAAVELISAMAQERLHRHDLAAAAMKRAEAIIDQLPKTVARVVPEWIDQWMICQVLYREAKQTVPLSTATAPPTAS